MPLCYFDAFSGISGDMAVGALLDAGADWPTVESALRSLRLDAAFRLYKTKRRGIAASKFCVDFTEQKKHRHLPHIEKIIEAGDLSAQAKSNALAVFRRLAEAESQTHDVPIEKVHFHEVGAVDSICDIVGACVALDSLKVSEIHCSRINVGGGTVETEHGTLPVPAPATALLLKDRPIYSSGPQTELTTPTGAALLTALVSHFGALPAIQLKAQGFGAGDKDFPGQAKSVTILEANIDDSTPQVLGYAMERLLEAGALDVALTPIVMKKNRAATMLSVVAAPERTEALAAVLFAETSTLGLRILQAERRVLARQVAEVETSFGKVRIKYNEQGSFAPEYEDCRQAAVAKGVPLRTVMGEANQIFARQWKSSHSQ
jgi:uncharacterized protein (TIGR00299 family) protein